MPRLLGVAIGPQEHQTSGEGVFCTERCPLPVRPLTEQTSGSSRAPSRFSGRVCWSASSSSARSALGSGEPSADGHPGPVDDRSHTATSAVATNTRGEGDSTPASRAVWRSRERPTRRLIAGVVALFLGIVDRDAKVAAPDADAYARNRDVQLARRSAPPRPLDGSIVMDQGRRGRPTCRPIRIDPPTAWTAG